MFEIDVEQMVNIAKDLGIEEPESFVTEIVVQRGESIPTFSFLLYTIQYAIKENKKLKERLDCMSQEKNS